MTMDGDSASGSAQSSIDPSEIKPGTCPSNIMQG
eukprot:CAMPEP_0176376816 /NCGR_PEP_ID=MMETSP0126-20121128/28452_1 /TAXON_ID=141414 ORGANISM="Strombidinopsis acuminatum, Strain SPMC142" /NCGR_SAMPLE_ID=MMETSP0126 /ASSEMBLY_ACC=CAM_ASM_000229 /LENGTH=33 /DNA_ID= /DNA_START= /DNA_END= /DNA_ORIENTATION=